MRWTKQHPKTDGFYWALARGNADVPIPPEPEVLRVIEYPKGSWSFRGSGIGNEGELDEIALWGDEVLLPPPGRSAEAKRDPTAECDSFESGFDATGDCETDGHYRCAECKHRRAS